MIAAGSHPCRPPQVTTLFWCFPFHRIRGRCNLTIKQLQYNRSNLSGNIFSINNPRCEPHYTLDQELSQQGNGVSYSHLLRLSELFKLHTVSGRVDVAFTITKKSNYPFTGVNRNKNDSILTEVPAPLAKGECANRLACSAWANPRFDIAFSYSTIYGSSCKKITSTALTWAL